MSNFPGHKTPPTTPPTKEFREPIGFGLPPNRRSCRDAHLLRVGGHPRYCHLRLKDGEKRKWGDSGPNCVGGKLKRGRSPEYSAESKSGDYGDCGDHFTKFWNDLSPTVSLVASSPASPASPASPVAWGTMYKLPEDMRRGLTAFEWDQAKLDAQEVSGLLCNPKPSPLGLDEFFAREEVKDHRPCSAGGDAGCLMGPRVYTAAHKVKAKTPFPKKTHIDWMELWSTKSDSQAFSTGCGIVEGARGDGLQTMKGILIACNGNPVTFKSLVRRIYLGDPASTQTILDIGIDGYSKSYSVYFDLRFPRVKKAVFVC